MRVGIFGGTFDPPHVGHQIVAADACEALRLDRLLWVPAAEPPHKQGVARTPAPLRLEMTRAAVRGDARFAVDDLELRRAGPSYSVDTLRALRTRYPEGPLFFLMGADQARELHSWREPAEVVRLARVAVLSRGGEAVPEDTGFPLHPLPVTRVDLSATEIRLRVAAGRDVRYLVPDAVREIIEREELYR